MTHLFEELFTGESQFSKHFLSRLREYNSLFAMTSFGHKDASVQGKRENNSHIDCGCPREKKILVLELEFIKAQRTKAEGQGSMQMGSIDYSETKKQIANAKKREQIREREQ
ncbi:hypothetical protein Hamer_G030061 [Homarus americanus]|uniref:Uncharacterized protein n=1 Tax=Homarus americanus TaxID=6706 RepID=A0A8J5J9F9_HOMAM|nr:hypothetical protein Hamer_G030061 [Homarus americanus]